jgi:hypothetical protein
MQLQDALDVTSDYARIDSFEHFRQHLDPAWIEMAIEDSGTWTVRQRRLPAEQMVWLVIAMGLFRDRPIEDIVDKLELARPGRGGAAVAPSSISDARGKLGCEPLEWLFGYSGLKWGARSADEHRYRGLSVYGVDGTVQRAADSEDNRTYFGGPTGKRGASAYPLVRIVALMALRSHLLVAARMGPYAKSEGAYARELWDSVGDDSVTVVDRLFLAAGTLIPLSTKGRNRHWLTRAKKNTRYTVIEKLGSGDEIVEMEVSAQARKADPSLPMHWRMRAIRYQRKGFQPQILLTSLLDHKTYPASEIVALYHERWELELGFDEIKTEMLEREESLRSQIPARVCQEAWGLLIAYNLVRLEMERVAREAGVEPTRISFVAALREIRDEWLWLEATKPGAIPQRLKKLRARLKRFILPIRRTERAYPRAVKIKMTAYPRKRPILPPTGNGS